MEQLKPCPHCGSFGEAELTFGIGNESHLFYIVECAKCWCKTRFCDTKEEAIAAWNQRATDCQNFPDRNFVSKWG